jgi:glyoxylase-like metal-dependent hydrolase (beta-lactamase superfamily II)/8-oxo-dGTP pyrophosphatase MutT (NUDIX family)
MPCADPVRAAAVILVRPAAATPNEPAPPLEVFLVRRGAAQRFLGDFSSFPGGREDPGDAAVPLAGAADADAAARACAARELFEETGVLLAAGPGRPTAAQLAAARQELLAGAIDFAAALARLGVAVDGAALRPAGRWITPDYVPMRYDTAYFLAGLPAGATASVVPGELASGEWLTAAAALARWARAELLLPSPVLAALRVLAEGSGPTLADRLAAAPARTARDEALRLSEVAPGLVLAPLRTPTLPPATHTNCYLVGSGELVAIDPGTPYPDEQELLDALLARLAGAGRPLRAILLTHHHPDHVGGAARLAARCAVPIRAHEATAARLAGAVPIARTLADGDRLPLAGAPPRCLRVVATPGHAVGHLAFLEEETGALIAGDLVATQGFIVVDPAEGGDMTEYLASLRRARDLEARLLLPAHGFPTRRVRERLDEYLAHRLAREALVVAALGPAPQTEDALLPLVYADTPPPMWPFARASLRAHLEQLAREGRARRAGEGWTAPLTS